MLTSLIQMIPFFRYICNCKALDISVLVNFFMGIKLMPFHKLCPIFGSASLKEFSNFEMSVYKGS